MRDKRIRGFLTITMFLVTGSLCLAAVEPNVSEVVIEPNDPNWTPSDCFSTAWQKVTLSTELSNPGIAGGIDGYESVQSMSISCNLYKADIRNLISNTTILIPVEARATDNRNNIYTYENPLWRIIVDTMQVTADMPTQITLNFPVYPSIGYPVWLNEVSWTINGLFAHAIRTIEVPFEASDEWIEIMPDLSIQIEEATVSEGRYSYRIRGKYEGEDSHPRTTLHLRQGDDIPQYIDLGITLLNENGIDIKSLSNSGAFSYGSTGTNTNYIMSGSGTCGSCGRVKTIQFQFAVDPYIDEMIFVLTDIPAPTF